MAAWNELKSVCEIRICCFLYQMIEELESFKVPVFSTFRPFQTGAKD